MKNACYSLALIWFNIFAFSTRCKQCIKYFLTISLLFSTWQRGRLKKKNNNLYRKTARILFHHYFPQQFHYCFPTLASVYICIRVLAALIYLYVSVIVFIRAHSNFIELKKSRAALLRLSVKRYACNRAFPFGNSARCAFYKLFLSACSRITCKFWFKINQTRGSYCVWPTRYREAMSLR